MIVVVLPLASHAVYTVSLFEYYAQGGLFVSLNLIRLKQTHFINLKLKAKADFLWLTKHSRKQFSLAAKERN